MILYYGIITALLGLIFGSFLNCTAMRLVRGEDFIHGRSHCMACGHELAARDLIPIASYVVSRGRCRYCGARVSKRYPLTELLLVVLWVGLYIAEIAYPLTFAVDAAYGIAELTPAPVLRFIRDLMLTGCLFTVSLVDLEAYEIPDGALIIGLAAWIATAPWVIGSWSAAGHHILAGILVGAVMLVLSLIMDRVLGKESLGGGDIKLFALLGLYLGYFGAYAEVLFAAVIGLIFAGALAIFRRREASQTEVSQTEADSQSADLRIPFGPAIALAGYLLLIFGDALGAWYIGTFLTI